MPVAIQVVSGESADDPLYIPAIQQVSASLDEHGMLYVGDSKMAARGTRGYIQQQGDYYLCPLPEKQMPVEQLGRYLQPVWEGQQALQQVYRLDELGEREKIAEGYEVNLEMRYTLENGQVCTWNERHLIVHSDQFAKTMTEALQKRLSKAQAELSQLLERKQGKTRIEDVASLRSAADDVLKQYRVTGLLSLSIAEQTQDRAVRVYGDNPARIEPEIVLQLSITLNQPAIEAAIRWLGWRVYATNHPKATLPLEQAVLAYREEYLVEHGFGRLKGKPLSLTPIYLQSESRTTALVRLLSIGLRILTLIEFQARKRLSETHDKLAGLAAGNPKRTTTRPTVEAMLEAFKGIDLTLVAMGGQTLRHITPLSDVQKKILTLLDFPPEIYSRLAFAFSNST
jgi:transposase